MLSTVTIMPKVIALAPNGHANTDADVAAFLRKMADHIESGVRSNVRQLVMVLESGGELETWAVGGPCDNARLVGLLTIAAARAQVE